MEVTVAYSADPGYLQQGLGPHSFAAAVARCANVSTAAVVGAEVVSGVISVAMPNMVGSCGLGGAMDLVLPLKEASPTDGQKLYCVTIDYTRNRPAVLGPAAAHPAACRCNGTELGEYLCLRADLGPEDNGAPSHPPPPPLATAAKGWLADAAPVGGVLVASTVTFPVEVASLDKSALSQSFKTAVSAKLPGISSSGIYITKISAGSLVVEYSVEVADAKAAEEVRKAIANQGTGLFSALRSSYGAATYVGAPVVLEPPVGGDDKGPNVGLIAGAAAGGAAALLLVALGIFFCLRRRQQSVQPLSGPASSMAPMKMQVNRLDS